MSEISVGKESEPVFLGLLEGLCFLCLFLSPLLAGPHPDRIWIAVALLRVIVLAVVTLPCRASLPKTAPPVRQVAGFLCRATLYQLPFWTSALFFPLTRGQGHLALVALGLQLTLMILMVPLARLAVRVGAESLVFLLTLGWVLGERPPGPWLMLAVTAWVCTLRGAWCRPAWGWRMTCWQALAIGMSWLVAFVLPSLSSAGSGVGATVFFWVLVIYLIATASRLQAESAGNEEAELGAPAFRRARVWLVGRRGAVGVLGWAALFALIVQRPQELIAGVVLFTAWWRGLELAAGGWLTPNRAVWGAALEITLVWMALESGPGGCVFAVVVAGLLSVWVRSSRNSPSFVGAASVETGKVEMILTSSLCLSAPEGFARRVMAESDSAELDANLAASAPVGFRERLMQRLRKTEEREE